MILRDRWIEVQKTLAQVILGKPQQIKILLSTFLAEGHALIEDRPGTGKTSLAKACAGVLGFGLQRIQCTNDLLPADIIGGHFFNRESGHFEFRAGPLFSEVILADELNRASPRTQSAFLQAMEESEISVEGKTIALPEFFFVMATQNPLDSIGVSPLPESQLDRFMVAFDLGLPESRDEQLLLLEKEPIGEKIKRLSGMLTSEELRASRQAVRLIHGSETLSQYTVQVLEKSRQLFYGVSPRAGRQWWHLSQAWAYLSGRDYLLPEDLQATAIYALTHRMDRDPQREKVFRLLESVKAPL